jgi:hypothetical protein
VYAQSSVLNITEGHQALDPLLWASIFEDYKVLEVIRSWVAWVPASSLISPLLSVSGPSSLSIFFTLERNGIRGRGFFLTEEGKATEVLNTYSWSFSRLIWLNS